MAQRSYEVVRDIRYGVECVCVFGSCRVELMKQVGTRAGGRRQRTKVKEGNGNYVLACVQVSFKTKTVSVVQS